MFYTLVDTAIGSIGLGWTERGVVRLALPGADRAATEALFLRQGAVSGQPDAALLVAPAGRRRGRAEAAAPEQAAAVE